MIKTGRTSESELPKFRVYAFHTYSEYEGHLSEVVTVTLYEPEFDLMYMITFPYDFKLYEKVNHINYYYAIEPFNKVRTVNNFVKELTEGKLL